MRVSSAYPLSLRPLPLSPPARGVTGALPGHSTFAMLETYAERVRFQRRELLDASGYPVSASHYARRFTPTESSSMSAPVAPRYSVGKSRVAESNGVQSPALSQHQKLAG